MTTGITELEDLKENLRKAWFYANKAYDMMEELEMSDDIYDEIEETVYRLRLLNLSVDEEIEEIEDETE